jgi:signal transduction histidine kinase
MLGLLRLDTADAPGHAPQPGIAEIPALIAQARAAGVDVELVVDDGTRLPIPVGVDLSAFRIVQEAVTNVMRHASTAHCRVRVHVGEDVLELRITDDGPPSGSAPAGVGHGIAGMRERVAMFGGDLFAGPVPGGGFAVRATLPLSRAGDQR